MSATLKQSTVLCRHVQPSFLLFHRSQCSSAPTAKPYTDIPTPPGGWVPLLGHATLMAKKPHGIQRSWKNIAELRKKYVPPGLELLRMNIPVLNPDGGGRVLQIFDPVDAQEVYRNEGKYPNRGSVFSAIKMLRSGRPDLFRETFGILVEEGETWQQLRSKVQQDLMRPKSALFYIDKLQSIGQEFVDYIRRERNPNDDIVFDFLPFSHRFGFESITAIALNSRLGCFDPVLPPDVQKNLEALDMIIKKFPDLLFGIPWWNFMPRRWSSTYRTVEDNFGIVADFVKGKIEQAVKVSQAGPVRSAGDPNISVLEKLILRNGPDSAISLVTAFDMVYELARNPDKQEKLRQEILSFGRKDLTTQDIGQMRYFRACLQESFRLNPTIANMIRVLPNDTVIRGYLIPAGTMVTWFNAVIGKDPNLFPEPDKYIPERWLEKKNEINPFAVRNFSHGPRMCIGKRFAELEIQLGICKLLQNFRLEWAADYELDPITELINTPDKPMTIRFIDIKT